MSDTITTYKHCHIAITDPDPNELLIEDIAHALSMMTRANGHFPEFYSIAQHCIHCCEEAQARGYGKRLAFICLLHDASEAYLADITRPVKKYLTDYLAFEKVLQDTIYEKFLGKIPDETERVLVKDIDNTLLYYEFEHYMGVKLADKEPWIQSCPVFETLVMKEVEERYIKMAQRLAV